MAEVEESIEKQISRLASGSLEMTVYKVFNRPVLHQCISASLMHKAGL